MRTLRQFLRLTLVLALALTAGTIYLGDTVRAEGRPVVNEGPQHKSIKWHPGHYVMTNANEGGAHNQAYRFDLYESLTDNTSLQGAAWQLRWGEVEPTTEGGYNLDIIQQEIDKLQSLDQPKRLWLRMVDQSYASTNYCETAGYLPEYLRNPTDCHNSGVHSIPRLWREDVMSSYIAMIEAIAEEFDEHPALEGIALNRDGAFGPPPDDYSFEVFRAQLLRLADAAAASFEHTNVVLFVNWCWRGGQEGCNQIAEDMRERGIGLGGPDVAPGCIEDDCSLGYEEPQWIPAYNSINGNAVGGGVSAAGVVPIAYSVEASELGLDSVGKEGGYLPAELHDFCDTWLHCTHMFWDAQNYTGTPEQRWPTGILPYINANPTLANTACPSSYDLVSGEAGGERPRGPSPTWCWQRGD